MPMMQTDLQMMDIGNGNDLVHGLAVVFDKRWWEGVGGQGIQHAQGMCASLSITPAE